MILVDTSIWVDHLRSGEAGLVDLLQEGQVACHPFVVGELACGGIRNRKEFLTLLTALPAAPKAEDAEALGLIERHRLVGRGLGWVDVHLLASCLLGESRLWTRDKTLAEAAARLGVAWSPVA